MGLLVSQIGGAVKSIRKSLRPRLSQEKLAEMVGVHRNTINKLENGKSEENVGVETVDAIASALGVSLLALLEHVEAAKSAPTESWLKDYDASPYKEIDGPLSRDEVRWLRAGALVGWVGGPPSPRQIHQAIEARRNR